MAKQATNVYIREVLRPLLAVVAVLVLAAAAAPAASAAERTESFRVGPVTVGGYEVKQEQALGGLPKPDKDAFITRMKVDVVD